MEEDKKYSRIDNKLEKNNHLLHQRKLTLGQRAADIVTKFCGTWTFISLVFVFMFIWMGINVYLMGILSWDPYPFILLNFILSCLAAIQAPIILMSQNREEERKKLKMEKDYLIDLKAEKEIEEIKKSIEEIEKYLKNL